MSLFVQKWIPIDNVKCATISYFKADLLVNDCFYSCYSTQEDGRTFCNEGDLAAVIDTPINAAGLKDSPLIISQITLGPLRIFRNLQKN